MIIVRTPLRLGLAGGGTDLPVWCKDHGSMLISAAINKYIYITLQRSSYNQKINLRYSHLEEVDKVDQIKHDIIRETFKFYNVKAPIALTSHADIPSATGLGSSGSFGVGIIHALNPEVSPSLLAQQATIIQVDQLKYPIGFQDQYVAAYGGINSYETDEKGNINVSPLKFNLIPLEEKLVMFYTGIKRDTNEVLKQSSIEGLDRVQSLAFGIKNVLERGDFDSFGAFLRDHWQEKKRRGGMTNPQIDELYELGLKSGAMGGKLIGAGGGGFLLFYTNDRDRLIASMPLHYEPFEFDFEGSKIIYED